MEISLDAAALLFVVALAAGCIDTIAGGGGLIALPALLLVGVPPAAALATNKLQGSGGTLAASLHFLSQGTVSLGRMRLTVAMTLAGAVAGVWLVLRLDTLVLQAVIPFLLIAMGLYFACSPRLGVADRQQRLGYRPFSVTAAPLLGFYDGFFGPGTGTFMTLALVGLWGHSLTKATAHTKVLNCTSNLASLLYFIGFGEIYWQVGLIMLAGQIAGASVGARLVLAKGADLIRPLVAVVCFAMAMRLLWSWFYG